MNPNVWAVASLAFFVWSFLIAFGGRFSWLGCLPLILATVVLAFAMPGNIILGSLILGAIVGGVSGYIWRRTPWGRSVTSSEPEPDVDPIGSAGAS